MPDTSSFKRLIQLFKNQDVSPSHDVDHSLRVAAYAEQLAKIYGGDVEVVKAAAVVHDLARVDTSLHGAESAKQGAVMAESMLEEAGYSLDQREVILQAVAEHDVPDFHSDLIESRILKDADFLDGFGARGIARSMIYAGETGGGLPEALERLTTKTKQRLDGLEFEATKRRAWQLTRLTELLLDELSTKPTLKPTPALQAQSYSGKFIVLEGISGSGKDTQLQLLVEYLNASNVPNLPINHPSAFFKEEIWKKWREESSDPVSELFLILADRVRMVNKHVWPALQEGKIVVSSRSSISSQVYQQNQIFPGSFNRLSFQFEPMPDLVLYFEIDPNKAFERVNQRVDRKQEASAGFFGVKQAELQERYDQVLKHYPNVSTIQAGKSRDEVHAQVVTCLQDIVSL